MTKCLWVRIPSLAILLSNQFTLRSKLVIRKLVLMNRVTLNPNRLTQSFKKLAEDKSEKQKRWLQVYRVILHYILIETIKRLCWFKIGFHKDSHLLTFIITAIQLESKANVCKIAINAIYVSNCSIIVNVRW